MIYKVDNSNSEINFKPGEVESILQNVKMILSTAENTVPLFREFGLDTRVLDTPQNLLETRLTAEIAGKIAKFEPRCRLRELNCQGNLDGTLKITATVEV